MKKILALTLTALSLTFAAEAYRPAPPPNYLTAEEKIEWQKAVNAQSPYMMNLMNGKDSTGAEKKAHDDAQETMDKLRKKYGK